MIMLFLSMAAHSPIFLNIVQSTRGYPTCFWITKISRRLGGISQIDWKYERLLSDPHSVMPLIKLIIGLSVHREASLKCTRTQTHTHTQTWYCWVRLPSVSWACIASLSSWSSHILSSLRLFRCSLWWGQDGGGRRRRRSSGVNDGWRDGHGHWKVQRGKEKVSKKRMRVKEGGKQEERCFRSWWKMDGGGWKKRACAVKHVFS